MFTGLIEDVGRLVERTATAGGARLRIESGLAAELSPGDSLAVNGVCLTAVDVDGRQMLAEVGPETLRVTTLGALAEGVPINLERPLRADGRLGGHFVQGHVDAVGRVEDLRPDADFWWFSVEFPEALAPYIVHKGSIAVDGISLTVAQLAGRRFDIQIVPFTLEHTNLKGIGPGDRVNLECDMVGKYVVHALKLTTDAAPPLNAERLA
jgi:riboflavin synthase